jgi:hypothetical protein
MNIEHFGFLSSVFRKAESHEQDGERLRGARSVRDNTASGDPAMALRSSIRLARADIPSGSVGGRLFEHDLFRKPVSTFRDHAPAATQ